MPREDYKARIEKGRELVVVVAMQAVCLARSRSSPPHLPEQPTPILSPCQIGRATPTKLSLFNSVRRSCPSSHSGSVLTPRALLSGRDAVDSSLLSSDAELASIQPFSPVFTYPIFGEEQKVYGYQGLDIKVPFCFLPFARRFDATLMLLISNDSSNSLREACISTFRSGTRQRFRRPRRRPTMCRLSSESSSLLVRPFLSLPLDTF